MRDITMVIPTYNSPSVLHSMLDSLRTNTDWEGRIIVVNNGSPLPFLISVNDTLIEPGRNTGWMGGVNLGLKECESEFVVMANDDLLFPPGAGWFWGHMMAGFNALNATEDNTPVGGVAPSSNYVSGCQNAFWHTPSRHVEAPYLIGMLALYRTSLLKSLGGLDEELPGGDDLDLSIRVRDAGYKLICSRFAYVHHIGSQTGKREQPSYWDSQEHQAATMNALIRKHGMKKWYDCWMGRPKAL